MSGVILRNQTQHIAYKLNAPGSLFLRRWRNILHTPVLDNHLVLCDQNSLVLPDDFMIRDLYSYDEVSWRLADTHPHFLQDNKYNYHISTRILWGGK